MESRKPQAPVRAAGRKRLPWVLALGCLILVAFVVVLRWPAGTSASGSGVEFAGDGTMGQPLPAAQGTIVRPEPAAQPGGAVIIDDPAMEETRRALESLPSPDGATAAAGDTRTASAAKAPRASRSNAARRRTAARTPAKKPENDLLSTLMQIIKQDEPAGDKARMKAAQPSSMDALVAQIEAEDSRNRNENQAALASLGGNGEKASPVRSPDVQQELRACPRANTVAGIECRRRVCAEHVGDAACPRQ